MLNDVKYFIKRLNQCVHTQTCINKCIKQFKKVILEISEIECHCLT